jgi:hypothetical protein
MRDHEAAMRVYIQLAVISDQKQQTQVRDRFLLLGGVEACRAGWPKVAIRCHEKLVASNPGHLANKYATIADALRDADFQQLVAHWERYCPFEKAEAMLSQLIVPDPQSADQPMGDQMLALLDQPNEST